MDAAAWDERYAATGLVWGAEPSRFVVAEMADVRPGRALDLAAGEGRNAIWLAVRGWRVTAGDFSAVAIDTGRRLADDGHVEVEWVVSDVLDFRPGPASFHCVLIAYLHLPTDQCARVLDTAQAALAPGGVLVVVGHDVSNVDDGVAGPQDRTLLYTPEGIT